jgi:transcriptional regulator with XRE-family HTH domain
MPEKLQQAFSNNTLRDRRKQHQWTQANVAESLGVTELTVRRWERGQSRPSSYYIQKLCTLFEASAEELGLLRTSLPVELPAKPSAGTDLSDPLQHDTPVDIPQEQKPLAYTPPTDAQQASSNLLPPRLHRPILRKRKLYVSLALLIVALSGFVAYTAGLRFVSAAGTSASIHKSAPVPAPRLLYQADWSKNLAGWTVTPHWHWSQQDGGKLTTDSMTNSLAIAPYYPTTFNYAVEVRIQRVGYSYIDGNAFGLVVMQTSTGGYVSGVGTHKTPEHFFIGQLTASNKNTKPYISADLARAPSHIDAGWHTYRVEVYQDSINF